MTDEAILHEYENAFSLSERMLLAARNGEWDALIGLEKDYHVQMEKVMANDFIPLDDIVFARKKAGMIQSILNNDEKIKSLVSARMQDIQSVVTSSAQSIKLNQAYRP
jgi:hypothetical protein